MGLNSGSHTGGEASRKRSQAVRLENRAFIVKTMIRFGRPITVSDVAWNGLVPDKRKLEISVARRELQEMVRDNVIAAIPGHGNNLNYELVPRYMLKRKWRKTEPDLSCQPEWF